MTTIEQLQVEVNASASNATSGIDSLSQSLSKLKSATKGGVGLTSIANSVKSLDSALKSVDASSASKISTLATSLEKLRNIGSIKISSSIGNQLKSIGEASNVLSNVNFYGVEKLGNALTPLNSLNASGLNSTINALKKLPELSSALSAMNWTTFTSQIQQLSSALTPLATQLNTVSTAFSKLPSNITRTVSATGKITQENKKATTSYINLWAKARMAYNVVRNGAFVIASWINQSNQYIEDLNLFNAAMGDYATEAQKYANQVGEVLGIDPGEFMRNMGTFNTIIEGFGVVEDKAYLMSKNLTQLGYDIASFYNISFEDSMQKLQSGISGELEPLRRLGYDLSVARLQQEAYNLGINKSVSSMTQAEKSQLRYYAIMTQVTTAQGDMARTLNAPANQLRVLQSQVTQCAKALGNIFIPALNAVLPYAIALAKAIRSVANAIASFFGFELPEVDYSTLTSGANAATDAVDGLSDSVGDTADGLGDSAKAAKKLKSALLGIDELNVISPDDDTSTGSTGAGSAGSGSAGTIGGSDLGIDLPSYDFLGNAVASRADAILKQIKACFWEIEAIASGALLAVGTILVVTGANIPLGLGLMAAGAVGLAATVAVNWNGMSTRLAKVLTLVTAVLGGFLLAIGAFLAFSGVNVPLGAGLMVAGAVSLGTAVAINWKFLDGKFKSTLSILTGIVGGSLLALGALFTFTGVDAPLGIALMAAGAVSIATAVGLNWNYMSDKLRNTIGLLEGIVGGALLALGAILAFSGTNIPIGIALLAAGAISIVSAAALNWKSLTSSISSAIKSIVAIVSGALIGVGAILALSGTATALGIAMIAAGAVGLASTVALNWQGLPNKVKNVLSKILAAVGAAAIVIGVILTVTMVALPLGIGLILAGATALGSSVALNWNGIVKKIKGVFKKIKSVAGSIGKLAIGLMLCFSGVGIPLGLALIKDGASELATGKGVNWNTMIKQMQSSFKKMGKAITEGIPEGLKEGAKNVKSWVSEHVLSPIKDALGIHSPSTVVRDEIGEMMGEGLLEGLQNSLSSPGEWVKNHITTPISDAIKNNPISDIAINAAENVSGWWSDIKSKWSSVSKKGLDVKAMVSLVKNGWKSIQKWIGKIPTLEQSIELIKDGWKSVEKWIGNIPVLSQGIKLIKNAWSTVKNWIGNIPILSQGIKLIKSKWTSVKHWIGTIPILSQGIQLLRNGWYTVSGWVSNFPGTGVSQGIGLLRNGWYTVSGWVRGWLGNGVSVTVSLVKGWYGSLKKWLGLADGGVIGANGGLKAYANGGIIPTYAGGTNKAHGSMFVAGEAGAELVGHVNGTTEVLNRFQLAQVMQSAIVNGMSQFSGYWQSMSRDLVTCANGVINAVMVGTNNVNDNLVYAGATGYDSQGWLSNNVYDNSKDTYADAYSNESVTNNLKSFYTTYVEPTLKEIAADAKRQADKNEQTTLQVSGRTLASTVQTVQKANGYNFTR